MASSYDMYRMGAESFALLAEPSMQPFWEGYKAGIYDRFHGGRPTLASLPGNELYAKGYQAGLEGIPAISLISMLLEEEFP